jgi:hypothetical protein
VSRVAINKENKIMQFRILKLMMVLPGLLLTLLVNPGCMLMHLAGDHGDHHEGTMEHGAKTQEKDKDVGGHEVYQQAGLLDTRLRTDSQGGITVQIQFTELTEKGELAFAVRMSDHVVGTNQYALENLATLANDQGTQVEATRWQSIALSEQRVSGTLYFPGKDNSGKSMLAHGVRNVTLRIKDMAGISERVFQWNLTSAY